jgi:hypothetical protein
LVRHPEEYRVIGHFALAGTGHAWCSTARTPSLIGPSMAETRRCVSKPAVAGSCCIVFVVRDPGRVPSSCLLVHSHEQTLAHLRLLASVPGY